MKRVLEAYCCAGGASKGLADWFDEVDGVDIKPQPNYPYNFILGDAIEYIRDYGHEYDFICTHPPCQFYSGMSSCRPGLSDEYPDLIGPTRDVLEAVGVPYVIENVHRAVTTGKLRPDLMLCGHMFGLKLYRHRYFESNLPLWQPHHPKHVIPASKAGHWKPGTIISVSGHVSPIAVAKEAMGIDWMNRDELAEAIPPAFGSYIGEQVAELLRTAA